MTFTGDEILSLYQVIGETLSEALNAALLGRALPVLLVPCPCAGRYSHPARGFSGMLRSGHPSRRRRRGAHYAGRRGLLLGASLGLTASRTARGGLLRLSGARVARRFGSAPPVRRPRLPPPAGFGGAVPSFPCLGVPPPLGSAASQLGRSALPLFGVGLPPFLGGAGRRSAPPLASVSPSAPPALRLPPLLPRRRLLRASPASWRLRRRRVGVLAVSRAVPFWGFCFGSAEPLSRRLPAGASSIPPEDGRFCRLSPVPHSI